MIAAIKPLCGHCGCRFSSRPRGLCWTCYYTPGVRDKYATLGGKYARRGTRNFYGFAPLPESTVALPGTAEKVQILEHRAGLWPEGLPRTERREPMRSQGKRSPASSMKSATCLPRSSGGFLAASESAG